MKTYYHVTLLKNLDSIMTHGLIPCVGTLSSLCDETKKRIYLFPTENDMNIALSSWLGETINDIFGEDIECCSLKINLPDDWNITAGECEYEVYSSEIIPPRYIKFYKTE